MKNTLYYGDNLNIMRELILEEAAGITYLGPPGGADV
jgi:hypothetical protein